MRLALESRWNAPDEKAVRGRAGQRGAARAPCEFPDGIFARKLQCRTLVRGAFQTVNPPRLQASASYVPAGPHARAVGSETGSYHRTLKPPSAGQFARPNDPANHNSPSLVGGRHAIPSITPLERRRRNFVLLRIPNREPAPTIASIPSARTPLQPLGALQRGYVPASPRPIVSDEDARDRFPAIEQALESKRRHRIHGLRLRT